jgi:hypothetical protein
LNNSLTDDANNDWDQAVINLSSDPTVNNNPNLMIRFRLAGPLVGKNGNPTNTSGNDRYDNFSLLGSVVTGVNDISDKVSGYNVYPNPTNSTLTLTGSYEASKLITVSNVLGQEISNPKATGKQTIIDVSNLPAGDYFITINELETGNKQTLKFVKN